LIYFDTSILVPLLIPEPSSDRVRQLIDRQRGGTLATSHWTRAEFSSMLAREVRMGKYKEFFASKVDAQFESAIRSGFTIYLPGLADFEAAKQFVLRYESGLRAGDALHLAIARNNNAQAIYSLDDKMIRAGKLLGLPVSRGIRGK
jgi:predicted nucleic acid-binding protein